MTLIVEDGTGVQNAESYLSVIDFQAYCAKLGKDLTGPTVTTCEQALRRSTAYIDNTYRRRFTGLRAYRRAQSLEWPRIGAYYTYDDPGGPTPYPSWYNSLAQFDPIGANQIPQEILNATAESAFREVIVPGSLLPDLDRDNAVKMLKAGSVTIEYQPNAPMVATFQEIEAALSGLLMPSSAYSGSVSRG